MGKRWFDFSHVASLMLGMRFRTSIHVDCTLSGSWSLTFLLG